MKVVTVLGIDGCSKRINGWGNTFICGADIRIMGAFIHSRTVNFNISFSGLLSIIDGLFCVVQKGSCVSGNIREYRYSAGDRDIPDRVGRSGDL